MAGLQGRFSMSYKDSRFFLYPTGFTTGATPIEIIDTKQVDYGYRTENETVPGVGARPLYIASGMETFNGTITLYGLGYHILMASLRPHSSQQTGGYQSLAGNSLTINQYRHPDCTLEIRKTLPVNEVINYSLYEPANRHFLRGIVFNEGSHPSSAEGTGVLTITLQFMFICYNYTYETSTQWTVPREITQAELNVQSEVENDAAAVA